jgi:hypothetical protein
VTRFTSPEQPVLEELARVLAKNYLDTSLTLFAAAPGGGLRGVDANDLREMGRHVFTGGDAADLAVQSPERTVLVVGAGASLAAFGDAYPSTTAAIRKFNLELHRSVVGDAAASGGLAREPRPEVAELVREEPGEFERALAALAEQYGEDRVREELRRTYGDRYRPYLAFEIIAHLFKHRFIDAIINFDFDELLDEAIEGEMGTSEYRRVYFEGQCTGLDRLIVDRRLKIPLYVKPYGTVSYPSSIRFTPDGALPEPMHRLISSIIGGHWTDERTPEYRPYPVNLVTVGFPMSSVHLLDILRAASQEPDNAGITIFHLNHGAGLEALKRAAEHRGLEKVEEKFIDVDATTRVEPDKNALAETIRALWNATKAHFEEAFRPRGIARHEIVHSLFYAAGRAGMPARRVPVSGGVDYFRARLYAEVAMAIARGNGQIDLGTMAESRVGTTFDLMRNSPGGAGISMHEILEPFARGDEVRLLGRDISVFRFQYPQADNAHDLNRHLARALWQCLSDALKDVKDPLFQRHLDDIRFRKERRDKMVHRLYRLASSDAHDISPTFKHRHLLLSRKQQPEDVIHTSLGLTLRFVEMMNETWDLMLAISENGKVMEKYQRHLDNGSIGHRGDDKRFCLILAGNDHPEIAARRLEPYYPWMLGLGDPPLFYVPEWAHNQHMVLLLRRQGGDYEPVSAVRYETPRLGNRVNPVIIRSEAKKDLRSALECFKRYLHMSVTEYRPGGTNAELDPDASLQHMEPEDVWARLLQELDPRPVAGARFPAAAPASVATPDEAVVRPSSSSSRSRFN